MATGAARLIELAFDPAVESYDDATSERILDAALALVAASGARNLTMDDVAARAGVGRMTVYRRFGARQRLIDVLAARECRRCLHQIGAAIDPRAPIEQRAADLFVATLTVIGEHPLLARLARVEPGRARRHGPRAAGGDSGPPRRLVRADARQRDRLGR
jgi:AcrR family transcriptional regulator